MVFDADELGLDPEDDNLIGRCPECGKLYHKCECDEEEEDDAAASF